jgi:hypothetical protein
MDFNADDIRFVPANAGQQVENTAILKLCSGVVQGERGRGFLSQRMDSAATNLQTERRRHFQYAGFVCHKNVMFCHSQD